MTNDFYCDEVFSGRTPVTVVRETGDVLAFHHTRPYWEVHIVVVPKVHQRGHDEAYALAA